jgi:hypothetical protein
MLKVANAVIDGVVDVGAGREGEKPEKDGGSNHG